MVAYGLSWTAWLPLAVTGGAAPDSPRRYLHLVGGLGPATAALLATRLVDGPEDSRRLYRRIVHWRVGFRWHVIAWATPFGLLAVAQLLVRLGGQDAPVVHFGRSAEYPHLPVALYWAASVIAYGFGEEIGWRGFLLPRLQARFTAFRATLLVSVIWAGWHVPLFWFTPGMSHMGGGQVVGWYGSVVAGSVLFTWLFNSTEGSVLIPAVFHGTMDIAFLASGSSLLPTSRGAGHSVGHRDRSQAWAIQSVRSAESGRFLKAHAPVASLSSHVCDVAGVRFIVPASVSISGFVRGQQWVQR